MGQISKEFELNLEILKYCREQLGLSMERVAEKVEKIESIETGEQRPTYKQLENLADLYEVPRWVFISDALPEEYHYNTKPSFRKFKNSNIFKENEKVRKLIIRVEQYRDLFVELKEDLGEAISPFSVPEYLNSSNLQEVVNIVRKWLNLSPPANFDELRQKLEAKSIFIFLSNKQTDWSYIGKGSFRGLCIQHDVMPIIIINDSDSNKAQSFTLMHELGHLLKNQTSIDSWQENETEIEKWCDRFAGSVLIPEAELQEVNNITSLGEVDQLAKDFEVSPYALLVRLRQVNKISQAQYSSLEKELQARYLAQDEKLKKAKGGPSRNRPSEVRTQFGNPFVDTVLTTWHEQELTLHKTSKLLGLNNPKHVLELAEI